MKFLKKTVEREAELLTLDQCFAKAARFGLIWVHQSKDGTWSVTCELPTDRPGVTAEVKSGYRHPTPIEAFQKLFNNIEQQDTPT